MAGLKIYIPGINPGIEELQKQKGYVFHVTVEDENGYYLVEIREYLSFIKGTFFHVEKQGFFIPPKNLILANECSYSEIVKTINYYYDNYYFEDMKRTNVIDIENFNGDFNADIKYRKSNVAVTNLLIYRGRLFYFNIMKIYGEEVYILNNIHDDKELLKRIHDELDGRGWLDLYKPYNMVTITELLQIMN